MVDKWQRFSRRLGRDQCRHQHGLQRQVLVGGAGLVQALPGRLGSGCQALLQRQQHVVAQRRLLAVCKDVELLGRLIRHGQGG